MTDKPRPSWPRRIGITLGVLLFIACGVLAYLHDALLTRTEGEVFSSNGFEIHYTDEGEGEPVILIHGLAANADLNWRAAGITDLLARDFRVIMFDLRGHGLSGRSEDPEDFGAEMVADIPRLMDHLDIERAHIAGYSLGGFLALKAVTDYPDRIASVAYCASGWKDPDGPEDILSPYRKPDQQAGFVHGGVEYQMLTAGENDRLIWGPIDWAKDYIGDQLVDRGSVKAMKKSFRGLLVTKDDLSEMATPAICFMGTEDGLKPYADDLKKHLPSVEYVILDGSNHITLAMRSEFKTGLREFFLAHAINPTEQAAANP